MPTVIGVSVVEHRGSYGLEMAVLHGFTGEDIGNRSLCYATPVTNDVVGWISGPDELTVLVSQVAALPPNDACDHGRPEDAEDYDFGDFFGAIDSMSRML